jgi:hypothetical protein
LSGCDPDDGDDTCETICTDTFPTGSDLAYAAYNCGGSACYDSCYLECSGGS